MKANAQTPLSDFVAREKGGKGKEKGKSGNCRKKTLHISSLDNSSVHICSALNTH